MERTVTVEINEIDSSTEKESLIGNTPRRITDHKIGASPSVSVTFEEVASQIEAVADPVTQQTTHPCELFQELRNEQAHRRHEDSLFMMPVRMQ